MNNDGLSPTCSSRRGTSRRRSTRRAAIRATCSSVSADGSFVEQGEEAGIVSYERARGAAVVDLNLDGLLDIVVVNRRANATLWRNVGRGTAARARGRWATGSTCGCEQPAPNVDAVGAWVDVRAGDRTTTREVTVGGGHASGQLGWLHTGIGSAGEAEVRVQWPDGTVGPWMTVPAGERVTIVRGDTAPRPGRLRGDGMTTTHDHCPAWPRSPCPTSGCPTPSRCSRRRSSPSAWGGFGAAMASAGLRPPRRVGRPRAQRQPRLPQRLRPPLRGGGAGRRRLGRPGRPRGQRVRAAWPPPRRCRCGWSPSRT